MSDEKRYDGCRFFCFSASHLFSSFIFQIFYFVLLFFYFYYFYFSFVFFVNSLSLVTSSCLFFPSLFSSSTILVFECIRCALFAQFHCLSLPISFLCALIFQYFTKKKERKRTMKTRTDRIRKNERNKIRKKKTEQMILRQNVLFELRKYYYHLNNIYIILFSFIFVLFEYVTFHYHE